MEEEELYRDRLSTVDEEGKRKWIYPKKPGGKFTKWRNWVSYSLLVFLVLAPFLKIKGEQLIMLNFPARKFTFFGEVFWPQDFYIFVIVMLAALVFIVLFTVVYGRVFCGWVCPQTIFMEMVFRKIEYWIEGDWKQQMRLNKAEWDQTKILKKASKHTIFALFSFLIANIFLAYIIGSDELLRIVTEPVSQHVIGFISIVIFSGIFYFIFAHFREQVCTNICPYGRLQGVLLDNKSIVVAYDYERGEQRGLFRKNEDRNEAGKGDCIDCHQCVNVCPTGIDIRNGTQLECVNCTACIDACDHMMENVGLDKGLIRYASEEEIKTGEKQGFNFRAIAYTIVLFGLLVFMSFLIFNRSEIDTTVLRTPGKLYYKKVEGKISNMYNYKLIAKGNKDYNPEIRLEGMKGEIELIGNAIFVPRHEKAEGIFFVHIDRDELTSGKNNIVLGIYDEEGKRIETVKVGFFAP